MTKDVISLSITVLLLFWHYISHKITFLPPAVAAYNAVLAVLLFYFLFKSFVKVELSYVFTINLFTIAENCTEK